MLEGLRGLLSTVNILGKFVPIDERPAMGSQPDLADRSKCCPFINGGVFACRRSNSVNECNGWPQFALQHYWLMPINCHFRDCKARLVTVIYWVSSALSNFTFYFFIVDGSTTPYLCPKSVVMSRSCYEDHAVRYRPYGL